MSNPLSQVLELVDKAKEELKACDKKALPIEQRHQLARCQLSLLTTSARLKEVIANFEALKVTT